MAKTISGEPGALYAASGKPKPSVTHGKGPTGKLKHLKMISLAEAKALGMFTDPVTILSPMPVKKTRPRRKDGS